MSNPNKTQNAILKTMTTEQLNTMHSKALQLGMMQPDLAGMARYGLIACRILKHIMDKYQRKLQA